MSSRLTQALAFSMILSFSASSLAVAQEAAPPSAAEVFPPGSPDAPPADPMLTNEPVEEEPAAAPQNAEPRKAKKAKKQKTAKKQKAKKGKKQKTAKAKGKKNKKSKQRRG